MTRTTEASGGHRATPEDDGSHGREPADYPPPLPRDGVLVHIGMHKTGTTAIQSILRKSRAELARQGVLYPGVSQAHHVEARALSQTPLGWAAVRQAPPNPGIWTSLTEQVAATRGRVLLSSEFFSLARGDVPQRLVDDLGGPRAHIVIGVRDLAPALISYWQQTLKQGRVAPLERWLHWTFGEAGEPPAAGSFWDQWDLGAVVSRWAEAVGPEQMTVVVVDPRRPERLPTTFEHLLELSPGQLLGPPPRPNRGLTAAEAEAVRQINTAVRGKLEWHEYDALVRNGVIGRLVDERTPDNNEPRPQLPDWARERAVHEGRQAAETIAATGVFVVGDLADLAAGGAARDDHSKTDGREREPSVPMDVLVQSVIGVVASATRNSVSLEDDRDPMAARVSDLTTRRLARVLASRINTGARRRLPRLTSRRR
jgi:hypothetical protein